MAKDKPAAKPEPAPEQTAIDIERAEQERVEAALNAAEKVRNIQIKVGRA